MTSMMITAGTPIARHRMYSAAMPTISGEHPIKFTTCDEKRSKNAVHASPNAVVTLMTFTIVLPANPPFPPLFLSITSRSSAMATDRVVAVPIPCIATTAMMDEKMHVFGPSAASAVVPSHATQYVSMLPSTGSAIAVAAQIRSCRIVVVDVALSNPSCFISSSVIDSDGASSWDPPDASA
jgi:hypothetical protein